MSSFFDAIYDGDTTPLFCASDNEQYDIAAHLLSFGANFN